VTRRQQRILKDMRARLALEGREAQTNKFTGADVQGLLGIVEDLTEVKEETARMMTDRELEDEARRKLSNSQDYLFMKAREYGKAQTFNTKKLLHLAAVDYHEAWEHRISFVRDEDL